MTKEQRKVREFFKGFLFKQTGNMGLWIGAGIIEGLFVIMMMIPYQEIKQDMAFTAIPLILGYGGAAMYLSPYIALSEEENTVTIHEKLKYLPIDYKEIKKFRVEKLIVFVGKIFFVILTGNLFFTYFGFGSIRAEDIIYVILMGLLLPIISNLFIAWSS